MALYENCHKQFLRKHKIQKQQAPDRQHVAKLPENGSEHVIENSHDAFTWTLSQKIWEQLVMNMVKDSIEKRFKGKWSENALADYCWNLMTDEATAHHRRACKRKSF